MRGVVGLLREESCDPPKKLPDLWLGFVDDVQRCVLEGLGGRNKQVGVGDFGGVNQLSLTM